MGGVTPPALARVRGVPGVCVRVLLAAHPLCWAPACGGHRGGCPWAGFGLVSWGQDPRDGKWGQAAGGWARPGAAPSVPRASCWVGPQMESGRCPVPAQPGGEVSWRVPGERPRGWRALPSIQPSPLAVRWVPRRCPLLAPGGSPCCRPGSGGPAASRLTQDPLPTPQPDTGRAPGVTAALLELARTPQTLSVSLGAGTGPLEGPPRHPLAPRGAVAASRGLALGPMSRCQGLEHLALWQGPCVATALPSCRRPRPKSFSPEPNPAPCPLPSAGGSSWALSPRGDTAGGCPKKLALLSWGGSWGGQDVPGRRIRPRDPPQPRVPGGESGGSSASGGFWGGR